MIIEHAKQTPLGVTTLMAIGDDENPNESKLALLKKPIPCSIIVGGGAWLLSRFFVHEKSTAFYIGLLISGLTLAYSAAKGH